MAGIAQWEQGTFRAAKPDSEGKCEGNMQAAPEMGLSAFFLAKVTLCNSPPGTWFPGSSWHQLKARLPLLPFKSANGSSLRHIQD